MFYLPLLSTARGLGCFGDTSRRAIPTLEGKSRLLTGSYRSRWDAIRKCASSAYIRGYRVFGVQHGGWCAASRTAFRTYAKYGKSNRCRNGKGGPWANDVYVLKGERHFVWLLPYFQLFSCGLLLHSWVKAKGKERHLVATVTIFGDPCGGTQSGRDEENDGKISPVPILYTISLSRPLWSF